MCDFKTIFMNMNISWSCEDATWSSRPYMVIKTLNGHQYMVIKTLHGYQDCMNIVGLFNDHYGLSMMQCKLD